MRKAGSCSGLTLAPKFKSIFLGSGIHNDYHRLPIGVDEAGSQQVIPVGGDADAVGTRTDEAGEMTNVIVRVHIVQASIPGIGMNGCKAKILHVIGTSVLVQ